MDLVFFTAQASHWLAMQSSVPYRELWLVIKHFGGTEFACFSSVVISILIVGCMTWHVDMMALVHHGVDCQLPHGVITRHAHQQQYAATPRGVSSVTDVQQHCESKSTSVLACWLCPCVVYFMSLLLGESNALPHEHMCLHMFLHESNETMASIRLLRFNLAWLAGTCESWAASAYFPILSTRIRPTYLYAEHCTTVCNAGCHVRAACLNWSHGCLHGTSLPIVTLADSSCTP